MKSAYDYCLKKWDEKSISSLQNELSQIQLLFIPEDLALLKKADVTKTIIVQKNASVYASLQILKMGFSHCLDLEQPDFDREVLVSCLMLLNSKVLTDHKTPFFLRGLNKSSGVANHETALIPVGKKEEIFEAIEKVKEFFKKSKLSSNHLDVVGFTADELLSNGLKAHMKRGLMDQPVHLFAGIDSASFVVGCIDTAGILDRTAMLGILSEEFAGEKIAPTQGKSRSAGMGLRLALEGASSLYIHCVPDQKTIFCCGYKIKNLKSNASKSKHIHFTNLKA